MQQFHLLNKALRNIVTKLTHRACNSPTKRDRKLLLEMTNVGFRGSGTPRQAWLNDHDERNMNHKQTEM